MNLENIQSAMIRMADKPLESLSVSELYELIVQLTKEQLEASRSGFAKKRVYYVSAEFLVGKLLKTNLVNLGLFEAVSELLETLGVQFDQLADLEAEPSLGNGGLGRLAACFLDSMANTGIAGDGIGLFYHFGLFRQKFVDNKQTAVPDGWIGGNPWFRQTGRRYAVKFADKTLNSIEYVLDIPGKGSVRNQLHLFDLEGVDETLVHDGISFDARAVDKNLTLFLYPDDSTADGKRLRLYQEYFMVANGVQLILETDQQTHFSLADLDKHVSIQINDTHPTLIIPELIYELNQRGLSLDHAIRITERTCAYTNHTILAEALETWPLSDIEQVCPHLVPIIRYLDELAKARSSDPAVAIIDAHQVVHMAHMDIHFSKSTNGVAQLHTDILKHTELRMFATLYPGRFNNKTNGISFRRFLHAANPELYAWMSEVLSVDPDNGQALEGLLTLQEDPQMIERLLAIKQMKRRQFAQLINPTLSTPLSEDAIILTQVKRMHEYKRQQMNALSIIHEVLEIRRGHLPQRPLVHVFGGKAAPAYVAARQVIHLLLTLEQLIEADPQLRDHVRIIFPENYNVSMAEHVIPATDISEQISLASKEASGTGNMKFMLNGALTLGTVDGANVEIADLVGEENIYTFGRLADEVIGLYATNGYHPQDWAGRPLIKETLDFMIGDEMKHYGDPQALDALHDNLANRDWFMTLLDLESYIDTKKRMLADYENRQAWGRKMLVNIAMSGFFSSDRTVAQYDNDIWQK